LGQRISINENDGIMCCLIHVTKKRCYGAFLSGKPRSLKKELSYSKGFWSSFLLGVDLSFVAHFMFRPNCLSVAFAVS
jgi:hypothetical protein